MIEDEDQRCKLQLDMLAMSREQMQERELRMMQGMQNAAQSPPDADSLRNAWPKYESPPKCEPRPSLWARIAAWWRA